jgi:DNA-binding Lrp family transcriptional regulator
MKTIDYRNATFASIQASLSGIREQVYHAFTKHGPGTTREISIKAGISILTLRPRTTELVQLGFIEVLGGSDDGREAVYIAVSVSLVQERFEFWKAQPVQGEMKL